ncbi:Maf-like protein [Prolixibacter bellariivorans]|uniref:dTTP/UTP pyrophosphatase n=1 Tax=Prolixibacter bellariivorans TaxID=314319 RepID=A0A5M4AW74_9BACT|nr:Maf-like protein [Prolixibacter bellariivorans]GET31893.1 Maf-like protein [Prolixibacter bellariivorans]
MIPKNLENYRIVLASKSPRRQQLLADLGIDFETEIHEVDEVFPEGLPMEEIPQYLARLKAEPFVETLKEKDLVITSDTIVYVDGEVLGKPADYEEAVAMLQKLSGRRHEVVTGVCLTSTTKQVSFASVTDVFFKELSQEEIDYYITHYKPYDKAGAYGIQEWIGYIGIERIEGSYFNVMGLPVQHLYEELSKW